MKFFLNQYWQLIIFEFLEHLFQAFWNFFLLWHYLLNNLTLHNAGSMLQTLILTIIYFKTFPIKKSGVVYRVLNAIVPLMNMIAKKVPTILRSIWKKSMELNCWFLLKLNTAKSLRWKISMLFNVLKKNCKMMCCFASNWNKSITIIFCGNACKQQFICYIN